MSAFVTNPAAFSIAAAHGITDRVSRTWFPRLPRDPRVMVPIEVEALVVRQPGGAWAETGMQDPPATGAVKHKSLLPDPFVEMTAADVKTRRAPGAYIHWALPDALTRGTQSVDKSKTVFPAVPDRWMVVRVSPSLRFPNRRAVSGWILQAGDGKPQPIPLGNWKEPGTKPDGQKEPLTALGLGDLSWAGYFDNVQNRLGMYDPLTDVREGPIAYLVCGWYSDSKFDPLGDAAVKSLTDFDAKMRELGWALPEYDLKRAQTHAGKYSIAAASVGLSSVRYSTALDLNRLSSQASLASPAAFSQSQDSTPIGFDPASASYTTDGSWWPQLSVYHGAAVGIGWPGIGWPGNPSGVYTPPRFTNDPTVVQEEGGPPAASAINVVVGNTMTEALARLVAKDGNAVDEARILEAFQLGILPELDRPDGRAQIDSRLHGNAFGSLPGGACPEVFNEPPQSVAQAPKANQPAPGPGVFHRDGVLSAVGDRAQLATANAAFSTVTAQSSSSFSRNITSQSISLLEGGLSAIIAAQSPPAPPPDPGGPTNVSRTLPRFFHPTDPVILLQGAKASFKHGNSGRFNKEGLLSCRLTGDHATELASREPGPEIAGGYHAVKPEDLLEGGVENGSVPPECEDLLKELAVLDPGSSIAAANIAAGPNASQERVKALAQNFLVEQTAWQAVRDTRIDAAPIVANSGISGRLPSAIAFTLPSRPWNPIHLDWAIEFIPSANGLADWHLDEIDYQATGVNEGTPLKFQGRSPLTQGASKTAADAIRKALAQIGASGGSTVIDPKIQYSFRSEVTRTLLLKISGLEVKSTAGNLAPSGDVPGIDRGPLEDIASALESMDVLTGGLDGLITDLRGGFLSDGASHPESGQPDPDPFYPFRAGFIRMVRLRLVDGFGQFLDLLGSGPQTAVDPVALLKSDPIATPGHSDLLAQPPRFTSPARLWFRFTAADGSATEPCTQVNPVSGFIMPNHLDNALEFFSPDGANQGVVRRVDDANIVWEDAPGTATLLGQNPAAAIANPFCAEIAQSLLNWGVVDAGVPAEQDTALAALLRVIDSTLWSVDPYGHSGDEHLSLLIGHPVVVMRALLRLEIQEPIHPDALATMRIPVRLGALAHWQDGLLGYFVNDDYNTLYCADAAVAGLAREVGAHRGFLQQANLVPDFYNNFAGDITGGATTGNTPVKHPFIDTTGLVFVQPNQDVRLTLLVEPHTVVHATAGLLPRKEIGMRREWVADALAKIAPTFRFGPLLVDPKRIRMPIPTDIDGTWTWTYRTDAVTWAELPVTNATQDALLPPDPPSGTEGWLRLNPPGKGVGK